MTESIFSTVVRNRKTYLAMVLERDLSEHGQGLAQLGHVDRGRVAQDEALRLQFLDPHEARTCREMNDVGKLHVRDAPVLLQFA
jgi:L-alanine-DL-glutamate epimerase-like enolase superfamily enzyme